MIIEPGRAFGTGHHGTTEGCLVLLEEALAATPGAAALDIGTGTGILAIAALKLGAPSVLAIDMDPDAVSAAQVNAGRNGCAGLTGRGWPSPQEIAGAASRSSWRTCSRTRTWRWPRSTRGSWRRAARSCWAACSQDEDGRVSEALARRRLHDRDRAWRSRAGPRCASRRRTA